MSHRDESHLRAEDERERNRDLRRDDGRLSPGQREQLNAKLDRNSARIYDLMHDGRVR